MLMFIKENPGFQSVYDYATMMTKDRKGLLSMLSEYYENENIVASLNKTNESMVKRLERENAELEGKIAELNDDNIEKGKELEKKAKEIEAKEKEIQQLKQLLQQEKA